MTTTSTPPVLPPASSPPAGEADMLELHSGDRMNREEFHRIYARMPEHVKAELIGGIVYMASPLSLRHARNHLPLGTLFYAYESATRGVESGDNATVLLGDEGEVQPDLLLRVLPEFGGRSRTVDEYVQGPPELVAEIAYSSRAIDLHGKRRDYARYGVREYLVLNLSEGRFHWFDLNANEELPPGDDGVIRARAMPGLWIHAPAVLARDYRQAMAALEQGLATPEHAAFVQQLAARAGGSV